MKNKHTLLVSTLLLILCVIQKEARYNTLTGVNVEKMYNLPYSEQNGGFDEETASDIQENQLVKFPSRADLLDLASVDSTSQKVNSVKLLNNSLLNITSGSKMLNN